MKLSKFKKDKKIIIFSICILLFIILTYSIFNQSINNIDEKISSFVISIRKDNLTNIMTIITNIINHLLIKTACFWDI